MANLWESAPLADQPASNAPAWADAPSADSPAKANLAASRDVQPDAAAEAVKLARRYPAPPDALYRNLAETQAWAEFEDNQARLKEAPRLEAWLAGQPARAKVSRDDIETLSGIENVLKEWRGPKPSVGSVVSGLVKSVPQGFRSASEGLTGQIADAFVALGLSPDDEVASRERQRRMAQATGADAYTTPDFESATASAIYGGATSTLRMAPGLALSIATRSPVPSLAAAGIQTQTESYAKYRGRGGNPMESFAGATGEGVVEVATELLPMGFLAKQIGRTGMKEFAVGLLARELPTEQIATLLQDAIDTGIANPDKTWEQYLAERPGAAYATLVSTLTQSALMGGAHVVGQRLTGYEQQAQEAEVSALRMEHLAKLGEASKLKGRDAETFKEFVSQVAEEEGDAPTEFFVDGATLLNTLNQSGVSREELAAIAPVVAAQLQAAQTGDVRVPVSEFLAAGEAFTAPLIDHLRTSPDAMTRLEAQAYIKEQGDSIKAEVEAELSKQDDQAAFRESIATVQQKFQAELDQTKRFTPDVNKAYASLLANFYGATAARLGMTPDELLNRYQLRVAAQGMAGAQTLNQEAPETPEFKRWFGGSKVVDSQGKPLVVYHGTTADVSAFSLDASGADGVKYSAPAIFATSDAKLASDYAINKMDRVIADAMRAMEIHKNQNPGDYGSAYEALYDAVKESFKQVRKEGRPETGSGANVLPLFMSLQNPLIVDGGGRRFMQVMPEAIARAVADGHDGLIVNSVIDHASPATDYPAQVVVAFRPEQIKSAIGNRGTFDPNDPSILNQSAAPSRDLIELRKRESILKSILECI